MISVFEIYKIGVGPSSSHTVGPMKAGYSFIHDLIVTGEINKVDRIVVDIYGSLSLTGKGHHTDVAIVLGLAGNLPDSVDIDGIADFIQNVQDSGKLPIMQGKYVVDFPFEQALIFHHDSLPLHENGMQISAYQQDQRVKTKTYYSIGGGEIVDAEHFQQRHHKEDETKYPHSFHSAEELLAICNDTALPISDVVMANELILHSRQEIGDYFARIYQVMQDCINRGIHTDGILPGPIKVIRRAASLYRQLVNADTLSKDPMDLIDWVNMFAMAVNEENADGGRVVTAPTNGACGIVPAVLAYYDKFIQHVTPEIYLRYYLSSGAIGSLYKMNASISGAEVGCQGEVGVACSMAAAGLTEIIGGNPQQVCMAAEIAMEHNLGLTCDPVAGQVQVPCIERNAIAAVKAINASRMAMKRTSVAKVSLDKVIETMYETGKDMNIKYRETSTGGLAIKVVSC